MAAAKQYLHTTHDQSKLMAALNLGTDDCLTTRACDGHSEVSIGYVGHALITPYSGASL